MTQADSPTIPRHRTALRRTELSRPIQLALRDSIITLTTTVFDYGCGQGDDVRLLRTQGVASTGWDPFYLPNEERRACDIVNLGYVLNVIENVQERAAALRDAWSYAKRALIVAARLNIDFEGGGERAYGDGHVTRLGTFQKLYEQQELREWIEGTLGESSVAASPGVFYVFRDPDLMYAYMTSRVQRISFKPKQDRSEQIFESHKQSFEDLMGFFLSRGRLPTEEELPSVLPLCKEVGNIRRAFAIVRRVTGGTDWDRVRAERTQDLLVYLALARFSKRPKLSVLPPSLRLDFRSLFSSYGNACRSADELLFSVGKRELVATACRTSSVGKLTRASLYVHRSALEMLNPLLRVYEGCARALVGTVDGANIVKLRFVEPIVSYLSYPEFDTDAHPALASSVLVHLQTFKMQYRHFAGSKSPPILHRKEEFVRPDDPARAKYERLTSQEEAHGLYEQPWAIGTRQEWDEILKRKGLRLAGHRLLKARTS